jgi:hypothetical protein
MRGICSVLAIFGVLSLGANASAARYTAGKVSFQDITGEVRITTTGGEDVDVTIRQGKTYRPVSVTLVKGELVIAGERWREDEAKDCCNDRIRRTENLQRDRAAAVTGPAEDRNAFFDDYPVIEVALPRKNDVAFTDARILLSMGAIDGPMKVVYSV